MTEPRSVGMELKTMSHLFRRKLEERCHPMEENCITGIQGMLLNYLAFHSGEQRLYQRDIERAFSIRRSTVTGVLQIMEKNGLLTRESDSRDARLKRLVLAPKGLAMQDEIQSDIRAVEAQAVRGLSAAEIDQFFYLMEKIRQNLES